MDAQADLAAACRRAGLGSWAGAQDGQQVSAAYQSAGGVMRRWGWLQGSGWGGRAKKSAVLSVNSWVCFPSHKELVWQETGTQGYCMQEPWTKAGLGGQDPVDKAFFLLFPLHCAHLSCNHFQFLIGFFLQFGSYFLFHCQSCLIP